MENVLLYMRAIVIKSVHGVVKTLLSQSLSQEKNPFTNNVIETERRYNCWDLSVDGEFIHKLKRIIEAIALRTWI